MLKLKIFDQQEIHGDPTTILLSLTPREETGLDGVVRNVGVKDLHQQQVHRQRFNRVPQQRHKDQVIANAIRHRAPAPV